MTIQELKDKDLILLECISGSRSYGLETETSDTDIKGVFLYPKQYFYGLNYVPQVNNETNDIVYYEFERFMELLSLNNPNILELLNTPESALIYKHPIIEEIKLENILSKECKNTFGKFALSQIKKAKGLNKKIVNPMNKERKNILSFCYVNYEQGSLPLIEFLQIKKWEQENCGLVNIPHMVDLYGLYYSDSNKFNGIIKNNDSNDISLSSIPKESRQEAILYFNKNGYSTFCKDYKEYWEWVENRNESRYKNTISHGKNYDAKNMMHTFRLLEMAIEIARDKKVNVKRPNRDFLLSIKNGNYEYDELLNMAENLQIEMEIAFDNSELPDTPNYEMINNITFIIRDRLYNS